MNASELLIHLTEPQIKRLFKIARELPADKLDWKPAPGARSALDQLQEVATALAHFMPEFDNRKMTWDQGRMEKWVQERTAITSIDDLERIAEENTKRLSEYIKATPESELDVPFEMPFPGTFTLADILAYHYWNASYHEGQIMYIKSLLE